MRKLNAIMGVAAAAMIGALAAPGPADAQSRLGGSRAGGSNSAGSGDVGSGGGAGGDGAPLAALAGVCGVSAEEAPWIGGGEAFSDIATSPDWLSDFLDVGGPVWSYRRFLASDYVWVRLEVAGYDGGDPVARLLTGQGDLIFEDDDSGGGGASRMELDLDPGVYCLAVRGFADSAFAAEARVGRADQHEALTAGSSSSMSASACTASTPAEPFGSGPLDGELGFGPVTTGVTPSYGPFRRFTLAAPTQLTLLAENESADPVLRLYDGGGLLIGENDDADGRNSRLDFFEALPAGEYCVEIAALTDESQEIALIAEAFDEAAYLVSNYDAALIAPPLGGDYPVEALGAVETSLSLDMVIAGPARWMSFETLEPGLVIATAVGVQGGDPRLVLFDDLGRRIDENDDWGGGLDARIAAEAPPGRYTLAVLPSAGPNSGAGAIPVRLTLRRYVPAQ